MVTPRGANFPFLIISTEQTDRHLPWSWFYILSIITKCKCWRKTFRKLFLRLPTIQLQLGHGDRRGWSLAWGSNCLASEVYWLFRRKYRLFGSIVLYWLNQQNSGQVAISFPVGMDLIYIPSCEFIEQLPALELRTVILRGAEHLSTNKISAWTYCKWMVHQITLIFFTQSSNQMLCWAPVCLPSSHFYRFPCRLIWILHSLEHTKVASQSCSSSWCRVMAAYGVRTNRSSLGRITTTSLISMHTHYSVLTFSIAINKHCGMQTGWGEGNKPLSLLFS